MAVLSVSIWITGSTCSGKTTRLVEKFSQWIGQQRQQSLKRNWKHPPWQPLVAAVLVLAANDDTRRSLADRLANAVGGSYPVISKTPLGFITDEVMLFWPLLFQRLGLKAQFPAAAS